MAESNEINNTIYDAVSNALENKNNQCITLLPSSTGKSAYDLAVEYGYVGTENMWLDTLQGKTTYDLAVEYGYKGSERDWLSSIANDTTVVSNLFADAHSFSDFMSKASSVLVPRRLAPPINTLNYYLDYLHALELVYSQQTGVVNVNGVQVKAITQAVKDALNSAAIDNNTQVDTLITATPQSVGMVARTQAQVNAETVSLLRFGAPYSTDSTTHLQKAIDYLYSIGGGKLVIPYHTGTLVISGAITLKENIEIACDKNLFIDCSSYTSGYQFTLSGDGGTEIPLASNVGIGDENITLTTTHNYVIGDDILLVSQRGCAHEDAGELWRLGETTANVASPFFAEPLTVKGVTSATSFASVGRVIFPNYRTDKTLETMTTARDAATSQKMNLAKGFSWVGGIFKKDTGSLFHFIWAKEPFIDIEVKRGYGTGTEVYNRYSLSSDIKVKVSRPDDVVIASNHSGYNSVKDVSSWYTTVDLHETRGIQGLDQSYVLYCGLFPNYKVRHYSPVEDGMTTHGCVYGAVVDVFATNTSRGVFNNRARFCKAKVSGIGCNWGLVVSSYGCVNGDFELNLLNNNSHAVYILNEGVTSTTPTFKDSTFSGRVVMSPRNVRAVFNIQPNLNTTTQLEDSGLVFKDFKIRSYYKVFDILTNNHGIEINNVRITHYGSQSPIIIDGNTGHSIRGLTVDFKTGNGTYKAIEVLNPVTRDKIYGREDIYIDYASCNFINCIPTNISTSSSVSSITLSGNSSDGNQSLTLSSSSAASFYNVSITTAGRGYNRLVLNNTIAIGTTFEILMTATVADVELVFYATGNTTTNSIQILNSIGNSSNSIAGVVGTPKLFKIKKVADGSYIVYS